MFITLTNPYALSINFTRHSASPNKFWFVSATLLLTIALQHIWTCLSAYICVFLIPSRSFSKYVSMVARFDVSLPLTTFFRVIQKTAGLSVCASLPFYIANTDQGTSVAERRFSPFSFTHWNKFNCHVSLDQLFGFRFHHTVILSEQYRVINVT